MKDFTHLHLHTHYSTLDCTIRPKQLMEKLVANGQKSVAITDHGNMHGVIEFYKAAKEKGIKPIIGCEVYVAQESRFDRNKDHQIFHLILLAMNDTGYKNLLKLVSLGYEEGFYRKPRVDRELLETYEEGVIALSACLKGTVTWNLMKGNDQEAYEMAEFLKFNFDKRFYLELQRNGIPEQTDVNEKLIKMSQELNLPLVATCDSHYLNREDAKIHELLLMVQTKSTIHDKKMQFYGEEFYVKSKEEMIELFKDIPETIKSTQDISDMCNLEIELGNWHFPIYDIKRNDDYKDFLKWKEAK